MSFQISGIPVRVHASFLLVAVFGLAAGSLSFAIAWVAIVFATTLVHELGHAVAFRAYGRSSAITLWAFGGVTQQTSGPPVKGNKEIVVSLAGPFTGILLMGVPALLLRSALSPLSRQAEVIIDLLVYVSIAWSAVNLLPILPLDGGHVAESLLEKAWGRAGVRAARWLSIVFALGAGLFALSRSFVFAAGYAVIFVAQNFSDLSRLREEPLQQLLSDGHGLVDAGDEAGALRVSKELRSRSRSASVRIAAIELAAWAHLAAGRRSEVASTLADLPNDARAGKALLACILFADGEREGAIATAVEALRQGAVANAQLVIALAREGALDEVVERLLSAGAAEAAASIPSMLHFAGRFEASAMAGMKLFYADAGDVARHAFNIACSLARAGESEVALEWLDRAVERGFKPVSLLDEDDDLATVRPMERFQDIRARAESR